MEGGPVSWARRPYSTVVAVAIALALGMAVRLPHLLESDFPLNDGGMFFTMSREILEAGYRLPSYTSYNFDSIPFAYPPLSFYLAAIVAGTTGLDLIPVVRYLPLVANLATIVAVGLLARSLLGAGAAAFIAPAIFALIPRGYEWMIMGGGLSRSVGFLFAVLCLSQAWALYTRPAVWRALLCGVLAAGAISSHLELGVFTLFSLVGLAAIDGRSARAMALAAGVAVLAVALASPWWVTVISRHGLGPFDAASMASYWTSTDGALLTFELTTFSQGLLMGTLGVMALLGAVASAMRGRLFLAAWLPAIYVLVPRSAASEATVPLALLAAVGLADVVGPSLVRIVKESRALDLYAEQSAAAHARFISRMRDMRVPELAGLVLALAVIYLYWPRFEMKITTLGSVPEGEREAMEWISENTPEDAEFLVLTAGMPWEADSGAEWFPVLAERRSVLTPQGSEWLPGEEFDRRKCVYNGVKGFGAAGWGIRDVERWAQERGLGFTHVYISKSKAEGWNIDWNSVAASAQRRSSYEVLRDDKWAMVLGRAEPLETRWTPPGQLLVARDCQAFVDQPRGMKDAYRDYYGERAEWQWVQDYDELLEEPEGISGRLEQLAGMAGLLPARDGPA